MMGSSQNLNRGKYLQTGEGVPCSTGGTLDQNTCTGRRTAARWTRWTTSLLLTGREEEEERNAGMKSRWSCWSSVGTRPTETDLLSIITTVTLRTTVTVRTDRPGDTDRTLVLYRLLKGGRTWRGRSQLLPPGVRLQGTTTIPRSWTAFWIGRPSYVERVRGRAGPGPRTTPTRRPKAARK